MINFLENWVEKIVIAIIIVSIFELILPNGRLKKYIKVVLGIYVVFCLISPFVENDYVLNFGNYIENYANELTQNIESSETSQNLDSSISDIYLDELKKDLNKRLEEEGYSTSKCNIDADFSADSNENAIKKIELTLQSKSNISQIEKVEINVNKNNENETIKEKEIKEKIANWYEINPNKVSVNLFE